jgi:hypothetical protein
MRHAFFPMLGLPLAAIAIMGMQDAESRTQVRQTNVSKSVIQTDTAQVSDPGAKPNRLIPTIESRIARNSVLDLQQVQSQQAPNASKTVAQISAAKDNKSAPTQLSPNGRNAQALPALTLRSEGRITTATPLSGRDRCDPRANILPSQTCAAVIENRAADYPLPDHQPLSPEQRLMASQRPAEVDPSNFDSAARRLSSGQSDDTLAGQAIASLTFAPPPPKEKEHETSKGSDAALVDALVAGIVLQATSPPGSN